MDRTRLLGFPIVKARQKVSVELVPSKTGTFEAKTIALETWRFEGPARDRTRPVDLPIVKARKQVFVELVLSEGLKLEEAF